VAATAEGISELNGGLKPLACVEHTGNPRSYH
jgi:hypothetical protein